MDDCKDWIVLGQVTRPHGVRGALRVAWYSDPTALAAPPERVRLCLPAPSGRAEIFAVANLRATAPERALLALEGIDDVDAAARWRGAQLSVPKALVPALPDDEIYLYELLGRVIYTPEGRRLGIAERLYDYGAGPVLGIAVQETVAPAADAAALPPDAPAEPMGSGDAPKAPDAGASPDAAATTSAGKATRRGRRRRPARAAELLVPLLPGTLRHAEPNETHAIVAVDPSLLSP